MKQNKTLAIALAALFTSSLALAGSEVSGKLVLESAGLNNGGLLKNEMKYKLYADGDITDNMTYHAELQGSSDSDKVGGYSGEYTQNANLRELYVDMSGGDWEARLGKQQVVWGTADGMKLLDIINPTDYAEMAQDQMEDARIPVWALNLESGSVQAIISEPKENVFAGLNRGTDTGVRSNGAIPPGYMMAADTANVGTDTGNAFLMMGPDTITGATDGFLNIVPDLGSVAGGFGTAFMPLGTDPLAQAGLGGMVYSGMPDDVNTPYVNEGYMDGMSDLLSAFTVDGFTVARDPATMATIDADNNGIPDSATLQGLSDQFVGMQLGKAYANGTYTGTEADFLSTYVYPAGSVAPDGVTSIAGQPMAMQFRDLNFAAMVAGMACQQYGGSMGPGTCATDGSTSQTDFDMVAAGMTGEQALNGFGAAYGSNLSSFGDGNANSAFEYMTNTGFRTFDTFVNARSQYVYNMPKSDDVDFAVKTSQTTKSGVNYSLNFSNSYDKNPVINLSWKNDAGEVLTQTEVAAPLTMMVGMNDNGTPADPSDDTPIMHTVNGTYIALTDSMGMPYGGGASAGMQADRSAILTFEQAVVRTKNLGGSFDTSVEMAGLGPVVIRGEALYTMDGKQPVMSKTKLSVGDLVGALSMQDADRFKFVLGADVTVLTNMLISGQYISDRNLDFIDSAAEYTTDYATMHLSNGFNKAIEDKQYYSLFFSKPFGESGQHRWNNITMAEEGVGENAYWNRLDVSWGLSDDVEGTFELNNYWGNANTQFGQLGSSSNIQTGLKYSF